MVIDTEIHNWSRHRKQGAVRCLGLNKPVYLYPSPSSQGPGITVGEEKKRWQEQEVANYYKEIVSSRCKRAGAQRNSSSIGPARQNASDAPGEGRWA